MREYLTRKTQPSLLILNQMAGPLTREFAEDFATAAHPVSVLTGHPDTLLKKQTGAVSVCRSIGYKRASYPVRLTSWILYCLHALLWIWSYPKSTPLLLYSNPPLLPWIGWLFKVAQNRRYAVVVHDVYPDVLVRLRQASERGAVVGIWRKLNRSAYLRAEVIITLGDKMAELLQRALPDGITATSLVKVVAPWADTEAIRPLPKDKNTFARHYTDTAKMTVMYSGNMGMSHDLETLIAVAELLRDDSRFRFVCIGAGPKWRLIQNAIRAQRLTNVTLLPWQPEEFLPLSLPAADVAFVSLRQELGGVVLPSKVFSFMAAGVPIIVSAPQECELSDLVFRYGVGWHLEPGDTGGLRDLLLRIVNEDLQPFREASRIAAETIGSRKHNSREMVKLVASALCRDRC